MNVEGWKNTAMFFQASGSSDSFMHRAEVKKKKKKGRSERVEQQSVLHFMPVSDEASAEKQRFC